jgi:hypothetical protein
MVAVTSLAACGDDEESTDAGETTETTAETTSTTDTTTSTTVETPEPSQIQITAAGTEDDFTFEVDVTEVPSGAAEIELVNDTESEVDGQLVFTSEERTEDEVIAELEKATGGKAVADWFQGGGGPGAVASGETTSVIQELQPGTYYVVGGDETPSGPLATITVTDEEGAPLPEADATIEAIDYEFSSEGVSAGATSILLTNQGEQWHHFLGAKLAEGATIEDATKFLETEQGEPPFEGDLAEGIPVSSTVMEGGTSQIAELELEQGTYAFFCFIADKEGGPPHVAKGMISEIEVTE